MLWDVNVTMTFHRFTANVNRCWVRLIHSRNMKLALLSCL